MQELLSDLPLYIQVFFGSVVGTALVGFLFKIAENLIQNRIARENELYKDKKQLAEQVLQICIESGSSVYRTPPSHIEHMYAVAEKVRLEDEKIGEQMDHLIALWQVCSTFRKTKKRAKEEAEFIIYLQKEAKMTSDKLLKAINKWRK